MIPVLNTRCQIHFPDSTTTRQQKSRKEAAAALNNKKKDWNCTSKNKGGTLLRLDVELELVFFEIDLKASIA